MADSVGENGDLIPGSWRQESADSAFLSIENNVGGNNVSNSGKKVRDALADYFSNEGCGDWQWDKCQILGDEVIKKENFYNLIYSCNFVNK